MRSDIRRAGEAIKPAKSGRIHTFIATSPIHMEKKLRMAPEQVLEQAVKAVRWAREYTDDMEFSPEDGGRSELDFLCRVLEAVIKAGATHDQYSRHRRLQRAGAVWAACSGRLRERVPNSDKVIWSDALPQRPRPGGGQLAGRGA